MRGETGVLRYFCSAPTNCCTFVYIGVSVHDAAAVWCARMIRCSTLLQLSPLPALAVSGGSIVWILPALVVFRGSVLLPLWILLVYWKIFWSSILWILVSKSLECRINSTCSRHETYSILIVYSYTIRITVLMVGSNILSTRSTIFTRHSPDIEYILGVRVYSVV